MNTIQLQKILDHVGKNKSFYYGVFSIKKLPIIDSYPSCLIMNNQSSLQEGEHWVAIYFNKIGVCEFLIHLESRQAFMV
jgi:hypothetical protein